MGEDPERIEQEIERTRAKLGDDLDALEEKVNPKKVAHRSVDKAREKVTEVAGVAREKVAAVRTKVGSGGSETAAGTGPGGGVGEKVSGMAGTAKEKVAPLAEKVAPLAASVKEKAAARAGLDPQTADNREVATAVAGDAWSTLREQTRRNPLAVGAVAFVIGVVLGR